MLNDDKKLLLICDCKSENVIIEDFSEKEFIISFYKLIDINNENGFQIWKNIKNGFKMMFGIEVCIAELIVQKDKINNIVNFLNSIKNR